MLKLIGEYMAKTKNNDKDSEFEIQNAIDEIAEKTSMIIEHYQNVDKRTSLGRQVKALEISLQALQESCTADASIMCSLQLDKSLEDIKLSIQKEVDEMAETIKTNSPTIFSKVSMNKALKNKKNLLALIKKITEDNANLRELLIACCAVAVRGKKNNY